MNEISQEVVNKFSQGDPHAFQAVFDRFRMQIFYFVRKMIGDQLTAEEITSDTFVKLYNSKEKFHAPIKIQAFLFITARNASLDFIKARRREHDSMCELKAIEDSEVLFPMFGEASIEAEVLSFILKEVEKLPGRTRLIFKMFYLEGLTVAEIAQKMGTNYQTVSNQKTTALKHLRVIVLNKPTLFYFLVTSVLKN